MIRPSFLDSESRQDLIELTRDGSAAHRLARRANALLLLDDGMSCQAVAKVLYLDDDTIIDHSTLSGSGFKVVTDEEGGGWRGSVVRMSSNNGEPMPVLSVRTWLSE